MLLEGSGYARMNWNNERRQLLFYTVDVSLLVENVNAIMKNAEFLLADTEEIIIHSWGTSPQKSFASPALNLKSFKNVYFSGVKLLASPGSRAVLGWGDPGA